MWLHGKNFVIIGSDRLEYDFNFKDKEYTDVIPPIKSKFIYNINMNHDMETKFISDFKNWYKTQDVLYDRLLRVYDEHVQLTNDEILINEILKQDARILTNKMMMQNLNGSKSLIDLLMERRRFWTMLNVNILNPKAIIRVLDNSDVLKAMSHDNSATKKTIDYIWGINSQIGLLRKYHLDFNNPIRNCMIYKLQVSRNLKYDKVLITKMKRDGGIYLTNDDHITMLKKMGL